ncbi:MobF family relaxase [Nocardioides gansuensis]|uniref:MobF family relaxase n=1 Tax=Nocardioides gansuensis TaxID=2138300 RepID=UPI001FEA0F81|nr:MobF family relaxase [Nocardioides gansuensis]
MASDFGRAGWLFRGVMGLHKLTAGDGYTYLTRQVAVHDATDRGHRGLADYYTEKGESPGRWFGAGLAALGLEVGTEVTEQQMRNLFGEGRHPDAERLENAALDAGKSVFAAKRASQLGRVFAVYRGNAPEFVQESARRYTTYNYAQGKHWKTPVPAEVRAQIRTQLGDELFAQEHGRAPLDDRERGGFMAKAIRQQTTAVAGYDLTFTPVKSASTLWALADRDVAKQVEDAHHAAVQKTLEWLEQEVLYTRRGRGGIQQVKAHGLIAGMFTHRDARSSDPHLHTHVAVSNKVQDAEGRWLAVDGRVLYKANVTLSETYNTLLERELVARLGVRFAARDAGLKTGAGKRPVREIVGIDERLAIAWSRRHQAIDARRRELAAAFQAEHGRPPPRARPSPWASRRGSRPGRPSTPPAPRPSSAPPGGARPSPSWARSRRSPGWSTPCSGTAPTCNRSPNSGSRRPRRRSSSGSPRTAPPGRSGTCAPKPPGRPARAGSGSVPSKPPSTGWSRPRSTSTRSPSRTRIRSPTPSRPPGSVSPSPQP